MRTRRKRPDERSIEAKSLSVMRKKKIVRSRINEKSLSALFMNPASINYILKRKNIFSTKREVNNQYYIALQLEIKHTF